EVEEPLGVATEIDVEVAAEADVDVDAEADRLATLDRRSGDERAARTMRLDRAEQERVFRIDLDRGRRVVNRHARADGVPAGATLPRHALTPGVAGSSGVDAVLVDVEDVAQLRAVVG